MDGKNEIEVKKSKVAQKLDENWLKGELSDLIAYMESPSAIEKFFLGLRHNYINPRDIKVIESYEKKFRAATKMMDAVMDYTRTGARGAHLEEEIELEDLERQSKILEKKIEIARKSRELEELEGRTKAKSPSSSERRLQEIDHKLEMLRATKAGVEKILKDKALAEEGLDPNKEEDRAILQKIRNMYLNLIMEVIE